MELLGHKRYLLGGSNVIEKELLYNMYKIYFTCLLLLNFKRESLWCPSPFMQYLKSQSYRGVSQVSPKKKKIVSQPNAAQITLETYQETVPVGNPPRFRHAMPTLSCHLPPVFSPPVWPHAAVDTPTNCSNQRKSRRDPGDDQEVVSPISLNVHL